GGAGAHAQPAARRSARAVLGRSRRRRVPVAAPSRLDSLAGGENRRSGGRRASAPYNGRVASERQIRVGDVPIGGGAPVAVQTMTKTETANLPATMEQIRAVAEAGADIVRCAVPREQDAEALKTIVRESPIPVIADIHFNHNLALK